MAGKRTGGTLFRTVTVVVAALVASLPTAAPVSGGDTYTTGPVSLTPYALSFRIGGVMTAAPTVVGVTRDANGTSGVDIFVGTWDGIVYCVRDTLPATSGTSTSDSSAAAGTASSSSSSSPTPSERRSTTRTMPSSSPSPAPYSPPTPRFYIRWASPARGAIYTSLGYLPGPEAGLGDGIVLSSTTDGYLFAHRQQEGILLWIRSLGTTTSSTFALLIRS